MRQKGGNSFCLNVDLGRWNGFLKFAVLEYSYLQIISFRQEN
jgi:hypothetical protein